MSDISNIEIHLVLIQLLIIVSKVVNNLYIITTTVSSINKIISYKNACYLKKIF